MKTIQRLTAVLISLILALGLFAGCGAEKTGGQVAEEPQQAVGDTQQAEEPKAEEPKAEEVKKEKIRFAFWDMTTGAKEYTTIVETFNKESTTVEVEPIDLSGTDYNEKTAIMLAAGEDIDGLAVKDLATYSGYLLKNQLKPIDELITASNYDLTAYGTNIDVLKKDGKIMALPYRSDFYILFYNKDIFDKAGVPYPTDDTTWEWFRETAKKLTSGQGNDKIWGTYVHTWENSVSDFAVPSRKGDIISGNNAFLKPAFEMVVGMQQDDKSAMTYAAAKTSNAHYKAMFESGKVGMHVMGTWHIGQLIADKAAGTTAVNWGIAKAPRDPDLKPGTTFGNLTPVAMTSYTKKDAATFEFMEFMAGEPGAMILGKLGLMPGYRNQAILDALASVEGFPTENKSALETVDVVQQMLPHKNAAQMKKILGEESELILTKAKTIDQGLKDLDERTKDLAADNK